MTQGPYDTRRDSGGDTLEDLAPGTVLADRYRVVERLGAGGMGTVYRAEHVTLRNPVAIKVLHRFASGDQELAARFEREARAAAHIDHPNVARAFDFGRLPDGTLYLAMEFVQGVTLAHLLEREARLAPARALKILRQIAGALGRAHALGVVHRDVKPDNVLLATRDGEPDFVKVVDFGIARMGGGGALSAPGTALTQMGVVFGTPAYLSPEQALGQPVDARADQYALGVVAFRVLTGALPYSAEDGVGLLQKHLMAPIPRVTELAPELPAAVDEVVARMMAKRPAQRFGSIDEAVEALARSLAQAAPPEAEDIGGAPTVLSPFPGAHTQSMPTAHAGPRASGPGATAVVSAANTTAHPPVVPMTPSRAPVAAAVAAGLVVLGLLGAGVAALVSRGAPTASRDDAGGAPSTALLAAGFDAGAHGAGADPTGGGSGGTSAGVDAASRRAIASRGCADGRCACSNRMRCSYACGDSPCTAVCDRVGDCTGECGDRCTMRCTNGSRCNLGCDGDCSVACSNVRECRVRCTDNCRVNCSLMMNCAVRMVSGEVQCAERVGACNVTCVLPNGQTAPATRCPRRRYRCPPGPC